MAETRLSPGLRSGEIARRAGVSADTLRHYERKGLLRKPRRLANGYRAYPPEALERVLLIQRSLAVGFTLDELAELLSDRDRGQPPCRKVRELAGRKLRDVERQLSDLSEFREDLLRTLRDWDARLASTDTVPNATAAASTGATLGTAWTLPARTGPHIRQSTGSRDET